MNCRHLPSATLCLLLLCAACDRAPKAAVTSDTAAPSRVEAQPFNGQSFHTQDGRSAITLISSDELEYRVRDGTTLLCKYSIQQDALRVIVTALGTQQVLYFRRVPQGLMSNDGGLYLNPSALAEVQRQEELARRAQLEEQAAAAQQRAESERLAAVAAEREADERRVAEERALKEAPAKLRALLTTLPVLQGTYETGYGPTKVALRIGSFDASTGAVSAGVEFVKGTQEFFAMKGLPNQATGSVSGDMLVLTLKEPTPLRFKLRYDGLAKRLAGYWSNPDRECPNCTLLFALQ